MKIIFVHVGKCAGGTIIQQLSSKNLPFCELHCGDSPEVLQKTLMTDVGENFYLISVRDPVSRFVSAFNFDKYEKHLGDSGKNNEVWKHVFETFCSANHLTESLVSSDSEIRAAARGAFFNSLLHIQLTLSWYLPIRCLANMPLDRTSVIRTEYLEGDLNKFFSSIGVSEVLSLSKDKDSKNFHGDLGIDDPLFLSGKSRAVLNSVYDSDYRILDYFYESGLISERYEKLYE